MKRGVTDKMLDFVRANQIVARGKSMDIDEGTFSSRVNSFCSLFCEQDENTSQLASMVTVLENIKGFKAMSKGKTLLYSKKMAGMVITFAMYMVLVLLINALALFVQYGDETYKLHMVWGVMIGISCGLLLMMWFLMFIVIPIILYLVCKSFHGEALDKLSLSTFLEGYTLETVVLPNSGEEIGRTRASI
nr:NADH-ubiquinone oxidoreductase chain 5-like [Tanacetum cinerariifolium]